MRTVKRVADWLRFFGALALIGWLASGVDELRYVVLGFWLCSFAAFFCWAVNDFSCFVWKEGFDRGYDAGRRDRLAMTGGSDDE